MREGRIGPAKDVRAFTPWNWGGYLVYAWSGARAFVDPLAFEQADLAAYERYLNGTLEDYELPQEKIRQALDTVPQV